MNTMAYGTRRVSRSNTAQSGGTQGTPGGIAARASTPRPGNRLALGDEMYLWLLILIEVGLMAILRKQFRRHHGG